MMDIYIHGKKMRADPKHAIGKGGEADIFQLDPTTALKLFKPPTHPDYQGLPEAQQAARNRLQLHQQKLPHFPRHLPPRVIAPHALATDKAGKTILGYTMPLLKDTDALLHYSERSFRQAGIAAQTVVQIFQDLHDTVSKLHFQQIVIGDFNDLNVLVRGTEAYIIDADSFQFASFPCNVFTARFVDPLLCDATAMQPLLQHAPTSESDWYAFAVMLMQCLLFVEPYGGVYKPKDPKQKIPHGARSLHRITVFHPEVHYPKPALPYTVLPDELLHYLQQVFMHDQRGKFPRSLLDNLRWTTCLNCGREHARSLCPNCQLTPPSAVKAVITVRGTVTATRLFQTEGVIVYATVDQGQLRWIYHDRGQFYREDGSVVLQGALNPHLRWRIQGKTTWLGYQGQVVSFQSGHMPERLAVDTYGAIAAFDTNATHCYWLYDGQLLRRAIASTAFPLPPVTIGQILPGQTRFWVGSHFGFGFYQAGDLKVAFVFDAKQGGLSDRVQLPSWQGQLLATSCTFSPEYAWFFLATQAQGQIHYCCMVIQADGAIAAMAQVQAGETHWLAMLAQGGAIAETAYTTTNDGLLAATDDGIIRVEIQNGQLIQTRTFPDTEPFVNVNCSVLPDPEGLYVIHRQVIQQLKLG